MSQVFKSPSQPLAAFVERFWYSSDSPQHQKVRVVPSGTMELVFNLGEDELDFSDTEQPESCKSFSGAVFSGTFAQPLFVHTRKHVVGVHFKPGGAFRFLGIPASEFANSHVDVEVVWKRFTQAVREQLDAATDAATRFRVLEKALVARLRNSSEQHRAVRAALHIFKRDAGEATTRELANQLGLSQRHFINVFSKQVGITPKQFARVQRFQRAAELSQRSSTPNWADIAAACGYFDQSHLIHDFKIFSGLNPTEFIGQRGQRLLTNAPIIG